MILIRAFERHLLELPRPGFHLLSSGEEAVAVGLCAALTGADQLLCSGRSLGPALARGISPKDLFAELLGKETGPCKGKGGRGHIAQPSIGFFGAHAVVGGNLSVSAGVALAQKLKGSPAIVACIFGDGACGAGSIHEALNLAALWKLPLVFVCNNNQYSVSTPAARALAPQPLSHLGQAYGIPGMTIDGMEVAEVRDYARGAVERARRGEGPSFLECISYRFSSHSNLARESRAKEEMDYWRARCPIRRLIDRLMMAGVLNTQALANLQLEVDQEIIAAHHSAAADPDVELSEALCDVD